MNGFDLASHVFALLPLYMAYITKQSHLLYFTLLTTVISIVYHANENDFTLHIDEFASSALIIVTFMAYLNEVYKPMYIAIALLLVVVVIDYYVDMDLVTLFLGATVFVAVVIFLWERQTLEETPQRLKVKDVYFASFISTQLIAVAFFLWDKDPYAHSLWHLFAFVSLGSAIAHIHERDENLKRIVFYCLGSIPSRIFLTAIFVHWNSAAYPDNIPIVVLFIVLGLPMLGKQIMEYLKGRWIHTGKMIQGVLYTGIGFYALIKGENMLYVGIVLGTSTAISAYTWYEENKDSLNVIPGNPWTPKEPVQPKFKKLQLHNLRF